MAQARAALAQAQAGVQAALTRPQEIAVTRAQSGSAQAKVQQSRASVAQAELNLDYTTVKAPVSGVVSKKTVEPGQVVQAGQPLLALVPLEDIWVTANFKETQLNRMRPGQPAVISVDAYGGRKYNGHTDTIPAATSAPVTPFENCRRSMLLVSLINPAL